MGVVSAKRVALVTGPSRAWVERSARCSQVAEPPWRSTTFTPSMCTQSHKRSLIARAGSSGSFRQHRSRGQPGDERCPRPLAPAPPSVPARQLPRRRTTSRDYAPDGATRSRAFKDVKDIPHRFQPHPAQPDKTSVSNPLANRASSDRAPSVCAGQRWSGAGSNRRPSASAGFTGLDRSGPGRLIWPYDVVTLPGVRARTHFSTAVVSKALARSTDVSNRVSDQHRTLVKPTCRAPSDAR
jgi:hypothetical protein